MIRQKPKSSHLFTHFSINTKFKVVLTDCIEGGLCWSVIIGSPFCHLVQPLVQNNVTNDQWNAANCYPFTYVQCLYRIIAIKYRLWLDTVWLQCIALTAAHCPLKLWHILPWRVCLWLFPAQFVVVKMSECKMVQSYGSLYDTHKRLDPGYS